MYGACAGIEFAASRESAVAAEEEAVCDRHQCQDQRVVVEFEFVGPEAGDVVDEDLDDDVVASRDRLRFWLDPHDGCRRPCADVRCREHPAQHEDHEEADGQLRRPGRPRTVTEQLEGRLHHNRGISKFGLCRGW